MNKIQKLWLWISLGMFFIPEILFSFIPSFFAFMLGHNDFPSIISKILTNSFLESNPVITFLFLGVEFFSLISLFIFNLKFNNHKIYKLILAIFLVLAFFVLSLDILLIYTITHMSFP